MTSRTEAGQRDAFGALWSALAGVGLALVIALFGAMLAQNLKDKGSELVVAQVFQQEDVQLHEVENKLFQKKTIALLKDYLFAFTDAAIGFETVPKLDTKDFYALVSSLTEQVQVQQVSFDRYDIKLSCMAQTQQDAAGFYQNLVDSGQFRTVTYEITNEEDSIAFFVVCYHRETAGQLAALDPAAN